MFCKARVMSVALFCSLIALPAQSAQIFRDINYYTISGKTAADLDRSLSRSGPLLQSTGKRHPGASRIRFDAKARYGTTANGSCKVHNVYVNIYAKVSLPRWKQRRQAPLDLALIWDTLSSDIKRHEESHLVIARRHASELEQRIRALPSRSNCTALRADIDKVTASVMASHDKAQIYFDKVEAKNFESRFARLLDYRLERMSK